MKDERGRQETEFGILHPQRGTKERLFDRINKIFGIFWPEYFEKHGKYVAGAKTKMGLMGSALHIGTIAQASLRDAVVGEVAGFRGLKSTVTIGPSLREAGSGAGGGVSIMGILPMQEWKTRVHGQDAHATLTRNARRGKVTGIWDLGALFKISQIR